MQLMKIMEIFCVTVFAGTSNVDVIMNSFKGK